jgi:hypothetical protein
VIEGARKKEQQGEKKVEAQKEGERSDMRPA